MSDYLDRVLGLTLQKARRENDSDAQLTKEEVTGAAAEAFDEVVKGRRYISDPSEAPEGVEVQEGERGGTYYEVDGDTGESTSSGSEGGSGGESGGDDSGDGGGGGEEFGFSEMAESLADDFNAEGRAAQYQYEDMSRGQILDQAWRDARESVIATLQQEAVDRGADFDYEEANRVASDLADSVREEAREMY